MASDAALWAEYEQASPEQKPVVAARIVEHHENFLWMLAHQYVGKRPVSREELTELVHELYVVALELVPRFNGKGKFISFLGTKHWQTGTAQWETAMNRGLSTGRSQASFSRAIQAYVARVRSTEGRDPSDEELVTEARRISTQNVSVEQARRSAYPVTVASGDATHGLTGESRWESLSVHVPDPTDRVTRDLDWKEAVQLARLSRDEADVLIRLVLFPTGERVKDVAAEKGTTPQTISQQKQKALARFAHPTVLRHLRTRD